MRNEHHGVRPAGYYQVTLFAPEDAARFGVFEVFSSPGMEVLRVAMLDAKAKRYETVDLGHIALGLVATRGVASSALVELNFAGRFRSLAERASQPETPSSREPMTYSSQAKSLFGQARDMSETEDATLVDTGHLLVALMENHRDALGIAQDEVTTSALRDAVDHARGADAENPH